MAPTMGPTIYIYTALKFPAKIIGPSVLAGFNDPPVMGPAMNTLQLE